MMESAADQIASWAWELLAGPGGGGAFHREGTTIWAGNRQMGRIENGVLRFQMVSEDPSIEYYRNIGGAHFMNAPRFPSQ
jgi:hypothetical protein